MTTTLTLTLTLTLTPDLRQVALRRSLPASDCATGCPELRLASANQPLGPRWPATGQTHRASFRHSGERQRDLRGRAQLHARPASLRVHLRQPEDSTAHARLALGAHARRRQVLERERCGPHASERDGVALEGDGVQRCAGWER